MTVKELRKILRGIPQYKDDLEVRFKVENHWVVVNKVSPKYSNPDTNFPDFYGLE